MTTPPLVDVNVSLSRWPCRRLRLDETPLLVEKLRTMGVEEAWASSFDALLHKDLAAVNASLASECKQAQGVLLRPFGAVNPLLPDWRDDLRRCHEIHGMPGIRLFPGYHGYSLDEPAAVELLSGACERNLIVQIVVRMEDSRTQHRLLRAADVDAAPLAGFAAKEPKLRLVLLNGLNVLAPDTLDRLVSAGNVWFDIASLEGVGALERLLLHTPLERLLLGSHAPFFVPESALLKLQESNLGELALARIRADNAKRLLSVSPP